MSTVNEYLLAAAKAYRDASFPHLPEHPTRQEEYAAAELATQMDDAIAAAERELAERLKPIDEEWLRQIGCELIDGAWFVKHQQIVLSDGKWYAIHLGPLVILNSQGQLLDLLSGLGIEVAK